MKRVLFTLLAALFVFSTPLSLMANDIAAADAAAAAGDLAAYTKAIEILDKVVATDPNNYEAAWKLSKYNYSAGDNLVVYKPEGWKESAEKFGRAGMDMGDKATQLNPQGVEGFFYYGLSASVLSDAISILSLLKEGILGKIKNNLLKSYDLDKTFDNGGPMQALASFYNIAPAPIGSKKKALQYAEESASIFPNDPAGNFIYAQILINSKKTDEAKKVLETLIAVPEDAEYYMESYKIKAQDLLKTL